MACCIALLADLLLRSITQECIPGYLWLFGQAYLKGFCPAHPPVKIKRGVYERRRGAARTHLS